MAISLVRLVHELKREGWSDDKLEDFLLRLLSKPAQAAPPAAPEKVVLLPKARKNHRKKRGHRLKSKRQGKEDSVVSPREEIRKLRKKGVPVKKISKEYKLSMAAVYSICKGIKREDIKREGSAKSILEHRLESERKGKHTIKCEMCGKKVKALNKLKKYCNECAEEKQRERMRNYHKKQKPPVKKDGKDIDMDGGEYDKPYGGEYTPEE